MNPRSAARPNAARLIVAVTAIAALTIGCREERTTTVLVRGTVYLDNKPLEGADVTFIPENGAVASGHSQADGSYTLKTVKDTDGVSPGRSLVAVVKYAEGEPEIVGKSGRQGPIRRPRIGASLLPDNYANTATSGLVCDVVAGQPTVFDIRLFSRRR